jgi:hypothetical protein
MADDPKFWVVLVTSGLALAGSVYTSIVSYNGEQKLARLNAELQANRDEKQAQLETRKTISKFRDPLMHASYDLQGRIFNILKKDFLTKYYVNGSPREKAYAVENTVFLIAQFLGWTEAIRQEVQFLDLGDDAQTRGLRQLQNAIYTQLQDDTLRPGFRLFAGEQRAIGELMIDHTSPECRCIGFAAFTESRRPALDRWLDPLREDIRQMAAQREPFVDRLAGLQHSVIDLLKYLDPEFVRFPASSRAKV